jgi:hypothetical protein
MMGMMMLMMKTKMCQDVIRISVRLKPDMNLIARKHRRLSVVEGRVAGLAYTLPDRGYEEHRVLID